MTLKRVAFDAVTAPPSELPEFTPINTATQSLPFDLLQWENFERICYRLAGKDAEVESHSLYGRAGQAQQGIDIFARKRNGRYNTWQAKRYKKYTTTDLKKAIATFVLGSWSDKSDRFYIAVQCPVDDVVLQDAIEKHASKLRESGVELIVIGGNDLSSLLREHPDIVLEFFGRACTKQFFGDSINDELLNKLDGSEFAKVRTQLYRVYSAGFELLDRIPVDAPTPFSDVSHDSISLLDRFSPPDVLIRETIVSHGPVRSSESLLSSSGKQSQGEDATTQTKGEEGRQVEQNRRTSLPTWLAESNQIAIIGSAGSGKSTVLRCLSLDLLGSQQLFPSVAKKWGRHLPLFISFAKWVRLTEASAGAIGVKDLLRASWQQQLTADMVGIIDQAIDESRVILFVDGLDEWANEQAARTTLQTMLTIVAAHDIPIVVSARPRGLTKIGVIPDDWAVGVLAPLSSRQQRDIATIWFSRNMGAKHGVASLEDSVAWKTDRFFRELNKGRGLATLAETPLLLLGLIALAIRRQVLPLNKVQALNQLTDVLLDVHPHSRATAAGDVVSRFSVAASTEVRRDALAALAFEMRAEGGDAGYPLKAARQCIKRFLSDSEGYAYSAEQAGLVANEILAVNSETIGLLVEKSPQEVGFVHASLEEYLASVHIYGWPIEDILKFVRLNASTIRWRSVFTDLIATTRRRSEAEKIVSVIDELEMDAVGAQQRRLLLADVAFGAAEINKATAQRLADRSIQIIEGAGWPGEQSGHLSAALEGIYNPTLGQQVSLYIDEWGIRRAEYLTDFYRAVSNWARSKHQLRILKRGISDENPQNRRAAAHALAAAYAGDVEIEIWLESLFRGNTDLGVTAVALEAMCAGWPNNSSLKSLIDDAAKSIDKAMRVSAIWCKIRLSQHDELDLDVLLALLDPYDGVEYRHRDWAGHCLMLGWNDHERVIPICLESVRRLGRHSGTIDNDVAANYLLGCNESNVSISDWIVYELKEKYPFSSRMGGDWSALVRFAKASSAVFEQLVVGITSGVLLYREYMIRSVLEQVVDIRLRDYLLVMAREATGFSVFWYMAPLLEGYAATDPEVLQLVKEVLSWDDERKSSLIALYPKMMGHTECRQELLRLTRENQSVRTDLLISAFSKLGSSEDEEVVNALLDRVLTAPESVFSGGAGLIASFHTHLRVREYALSQLTKREIPLMSLAVTFRDDNQIHQLISERVSSLSLPMRQMIIEAAANEFDRSDASRQLLEQYDCEIDGALKVQCAVRHFQALYSTDIEREPIVRRLLSDAIAVGHDHNDRRAAAFAGLIAFGATNQFVPLQWGPKPLEISLGMHGRESQALLRLIAEHWSELSGVFQGSVIDRITSGISSEEHFWSTMSPYVSADSLLRKNFIDYCDNSHQCLDLQSLRALSRELPKSDLLKRHCWLAINIEEKNKNLSSWESYQNYFEASYILRDQFGGESETVSRLVDAVKRSDFQHCIAALAIYDSKNETLNELAGRVVEIAQKTQDYCAPMILASARADSHQFNMMTKMMINRSSYSIWDFQERINSTVRARLIRDDGFSVLIKESLASKPTESEVSSLSRYLVTTGNLDEGTYELCKGLLNERNSASGIPAHGFDAIADAVRPVVHSLLDVLAGPVG